MGAGKYDRRVRIERAIDARNELGETLPAGWSVLADVWTKVAPAPGRERFQSGETAAEATTVFTVRWQRQLADLSPRDRLRYPLSAISGAAAELYNIHAVIELGRRDELQITATRRGDTP